MRVSTLRSLLSHNTANVISSPGNVRRIEIDCHVGGRIGCETNYQVASVSCQKVSVTADASAHKTHRPTSSSPSTKVQNKTDSLIWLNEMCVVGEPETCLT